MFEWYKKEAPFFTGIARGVGGAGFGKRAGGGGPVSVPFSATGGGTFILTSQPGATFDGAGDYKVHMFYEPGNFIVSRVSTPGKIEYVIVAGGGGGGCNNAGGGGGGGMLVSTYTLPQTGAATYQISVGPGGTGGQPGGGSGSKGTPSYIYNATHIVGPPSSSPGTIEAFGGGGGQGGNYGLTPPEPVIPNASFDGGTGGGDGRNLKSRGGTGDTPPVGAPFGGPQGKPGGRNHPAGPLGGGGGGGGSGGLPGGTAPARGTSPPGPHHAAGGDGTSVPWLPGPGIYPLIPAPYAPVFPTAWRDALTSSGYFAGGGGGGGPQPSPPQPDLGGLGGGGRGGSNGEFNVAGINYTGGGGGGDFNAGRSGSPGGAGIIFIRYKV